MLPVAVCNSPVNVTSHQGLQSLEVACFWCVLSSEICFWCDDVLVLEHRERTTVACLLYGVHAESMHRRRRNAGDHVDELFLLCVLGIDCDAVKDVAGWSVDLRPVPVDGVSPVSLEVARSGCREADDLSLIHI